MSDRTDLFIQIIKENSSLAPPLHKSTRKGHLFHCRLLPFCFRFAFPLFPHTLDSYLLP